jgi:diacylglycerol kinase (ATP)
MAYQNAKGLKRLVNAFGYSMAGLRACFQHEEAFRQEVFASIFVLPLALWLGNSGTERALLAGSWLIILVVELLNSAVEANVDRVGLERHELSARAKDIASAAVFLSLVFAAVVWLLVLVPKIA